MTDACDYTCDECGDFGAHRFIMIRYHEADEIEVSFCSDACTNQWLTLRALEAQL